jgi:hypothetical protein
VIDYERFGTYSPRPLTKRFGSWANIPAAMMDFVQRDGIEDEWKDVLELVREREGSLPGAETRPVYKAYVGFETEAI